MEATNKNDISSGGGHPMNGGNGTDSYSNNSALQRKVGDSIKPILDEAIAAKLDATKFVTPTTFRIADLGCAAGPNTFVVIQNIIEAVTAKVNKYHIPEFHVFFNDRVSNDFNTLFTSLDKDYSKTRAYYAAGVPGSFHGRLFPSRSLDFVYTSWSLHWLSRVPKEVQDKNNVAWNKGRISYGNAHQEVVMAFKNQHNRDMDTFLRARAHEIVSGGLMVLVFTTRKDERPHSDLFLNKMHDAWGSSVADLVKKGAIDEESFDSFNIPLYFPSPAEVQESISRNGCFNLERCVSVPHEAVSHTGPESLSWHTRAVMQGLFEEHFEHDIFDEVFEILQKKFEQGYAEIVSGEPIDLFVLLSRK